MNTHPGQAQADPRLTEFAMCLIQATPDNLPPEVELLGVLSYMKAIVDLHPARYHHTAAVLRAIADELSERATH